MKKEQKIAWFIGGMVLTAIGFIVIPPLINKLSAKLYKASLKHEKVDIDSLEPTIVKKNSEENE